MTVVTRPAVPAAPAGAGRSVDLRGEATSARQLAAQLWAARELLVILTRKEFHVKYRRAAFGVLWALALPLLQSLVLAVVFSKVAHIHGAPHYSVFVLSAMAPWVYFSSALAAGSTAVVDSTDLSSKVYFPRLVLPLAQVGAALYGYVVTVAIVLVLCPALGVGLSVRTLAVLPASVLVMALVTGLAATCAALHVYFRDVRYLVSAALLMWFYVTPVVYPPSAAPGGLGTLIDANPMTGVCDLFRFATVGHTGPLLLPVVVSVGWALVSLAAAGLLHCRYDRVFADLL